MTDQSRAVITANAERDAEAHKDDPGQYRPPSADDRWVAEYIDSKALDAKTKRT